MHIVYLRSDDYARLTGGFVYNSRLVAALSGQVVGLTEFPVPVAFPTIDEAGRKQLAAAFAAFTPDTILLSDHLHICDIEPLLAARPFRIVSVFHHSKTIEDRLNGRPADREAEQHGFDLCHAVVVTSDATREYLLAHYAIAPERIVVAIPGHERVARSAGPAAGTRNILTVGAVIPRKRQDFLIGVATLLRSAGWRWRIVGDLQRDPGYVALLRGRIAEAGLAGAVELVGGVDAAGLERLWSDSALLVAASHYEGYGMAVAEALRHGVPVVTTQSGAIGAWAGAGAVIAPADDAAAFAGLVDVLLADTPALARLGDEAWAFGAALPAWEETFADIGARIAAAIAAGSVAAA